MYASNIKQLFCPWVSSRIGSVTVWVCRSGPLVFIDYTVISKCGCQSLWEWRQEYVKEMHLKFLVLIKMTDLEGVHSCVKFVCAVSWKNARLAFFFPIIYEGISSLVVHWYFKIRRAKRSDRCYFRLSIQRKRKQTATIGLSLEKKNKLGNEKDMLPIVNFFF